MDKDKDAKLTYEEFVEGSKQDPTIVQVRASLIGAILTKSASRHCRYTMA